MPPVPRILASRRGVLLLAIALLAPVGAQANPADLFGLGGPSMGRAKVGLLLDADAFAVWRNPATMAFAERDDFSFSAYGGWMRFDCFDGQAPGDDGCAASIHSDGDQDGLVRADDPDDLWSPPAYESPNGLQLGYLRAFRKWLRVAFAATLPGNRVALVEMQDPYLPHYIRWKNRPQRLGLYLGASVRPVDGLSVGLGFSILAQARIDLDFDITAEVSDGELQGEGSAVRADLYVNPRSVRAEIRPAVAPIIGLAWDLGMLTPALKGLRLGAVYRHPIQIKVEPTVLGLEFNVVVTDIEDLGEVLIPIQAQVVYTAVDFATPRQVAWSVSYDHPRFAVGLDMSWNQWSKVVPNVAIIDEDLTDMQVGLIDLDADVLNARSLDDLQLHDTVDARLGIELRPPAARLRGKVGSRFGELGLVVRAGYGLEPTFVGEQSGRTTVLDNTTHVVSGGLGLWTFDPFQLLRGPVSLDGFVQLHLLQDRVHTKVAQPDPGDLPEGWPEGGQVHSGGLVIVAGGSLRLSI